MKKFLFKIVFSLIPVAAWFLVLGSFADGNTDDNYRHFTSPKFNNAVFGDSRASQGINPFVLDKTIRNHTFDNFALNIVHSPYGEIYLDAIKKKINPATENGIYILGIDPWCLSLDKNVHSISQLPEYNSPLRNLYFYDLNPNYEYLFKNYHKTWYHIYRDREEIAKSNSYLHKNGWMEVTVDMNAKSLEKREDEKVKDYKRYAKQQYLSKYRLNYLNKTIAFLKNHGSVYIVRIPASEKIMNIEENKFIDFDSKIEEIANKNRIHYFNFKNSFSKYNYTDGNHMYKESGKIFSAQIADSILKYSK